MIGFLRHLRHEGPRHGLLAAQPVVELVCTQWDALWCPIHGRCWCGRRLGDTECCQLHHPLSSHAIEHTAVGR